MKVSAVTKGPLMMCSKSPDRFPEYALLTINSHQRSSIQPLKHASSGPRLSSRLSAAAGLKRQEPQLGSLSLHQEEVNVAVLFGILISHAFIASSRFNKLTSWRSSSAKSSITTMKLLLAPLHGALAFCFQQQRRGMSFLRGGLRGFSG